MNLKSIRSQMLISLLFGILILSGLLGYFVDKQLKRLPDQSMLQYQEITNARAGELNKILEKYVEEVKMISQSSVVKSMDMEKIQKFLPSVVIEGNHRNMTIAGLDGKGWTTQGNEIDISGQEQYLKIFDEEEVYWISQPFLSPFADPDIPIVTISHEVRNHDIVVGLVNIVIDINFLTNVVNSINVGETSYAWVVDRNSQIIVHPDGIIGIDQHISYHIPDLEVADDLIMQNNLRWLKYKDDQGGEVFTFYKDIKGSPGWTLLLSISTDEVLGSINDIRLNIFLAFIMIVIAVSFFAYFYSNSISKPILKLKEVFEEAESGNTEVVADETVRNEIGTAAKSFNKMLRKIKMLTYYDPLTHLYNFNGFLLELPYQIKKITNKYPVSAIVIVSIDNFKRINSISGYLEGNLVLQIFLYLSTQKRSTNQLKKGPLI
ncbi:cache domain-containing protein [Bacillaceae bacterium IKA-2]|nr:cache domain-containing protein [Bacillaceae bacterium IKA-2]